jgi:hypothetical protein
VSTFILQLSETHLAAKPGTNYQSKNPEKMLIIKDLKTSIFSSQPPFWWLPWEEVRILQTPPKESTP